MATRAVIRNEHTVECSGLDTEDRRLSLRLAMDEKPQYTAEEVAKHADKSSCWLVIDGKVYAVEKFLSEHPGGEDVLLETAGRDATREFEDVGHSKSAREQLREFYIGDLRALTAEEAAATRAANAREKTDVGDQARFGINGSAKERIFAGGAFGAEPTPDGTGTWLVLRRILVPVCIAVLVYFVRQYTKRMSGGE
jgi:cytochrome b involved in lipid metabolism